jgi:hypothetical protein
MKGSRLVADSSNFALSVCIKYRSRRYEMILYNRETEDARELHTKQAEHCDKGVQDPFKNCSQPGVRNTRPVSSF